MSKKFIIAGNYAQATSWMRIDMMERAAAGETPFVSDYVVVSGEHSLRGYSDPHGVLIGSWRQRKDIRDILITLHFQSTTTNQAIVKILNGMTKSESELAVSIAAKQLANEIDKEVMNTIIKHKPLSNPRQLP